MLQHTVVVDPDTSIAERGAARRWLGRSWGMVHPWGSGRVYPNWPDPDLKDWARAHYGANYERLARVKATYYRGDFFRFRESLLSRVSGSGVPAVKAYSSLFVP